MSIYNNRKEALKFFKEHLTESQRIAFRRMVRDQLSPNMRADRVVDLIPEKELEKHLPSIFDALREAAETQRAQPEDGAASQQPIQSVSRLEIARELISFNESDWDSDGVFAKMGKNLNQKGRDALLRYAAAKFAVSLTVEGTPARHEAIRNFGEVHRQAFTDTQGNSNKGLIGSRADNIIQEAKRRAARRH